MEKILVLGDIHGRNIWIDIIEKENPNLVVFLGDYITSREGISEEEQLANLEDILNYKEDNPDKVILLRGNHDTSVFSWGRCYPMFNKVNLFPLKRFEKLTQWIYIKDNIIFSHAGVSKVFLERNNLKLEDLLEHKVFNDTLYAFTGDPFDSYGESPQQPPTWIRPWTLTYNLPDDYIQVVGHTTMQLCSKWICNNRLWVCDALGNRSYLVIENNEFKPKKYESTSS